MLNIIGNMMLAIPILIMLVAMAIFFGMLAYESFMKNPKENAIHIACTLGLFAWIGTALYLIELGKS